jgi:hypothetical protein
MAKKKATKKKGALSKRIWKFQESAVALALAEHIPPSTVHWNSDKSSTPDGMSIDPDVVIGSDTDKPDALVFVTHAAAEMAGQKKFWRTVAEVVEAKRLASEPKVLSVLFSGNVKPELKVAYSHLFDGVLHLSGTEGSEFSQFITGLAITHGDKPAEACGEILEGLVEEDGVPHWDWFSGQIKSLSDAETGATHDLITSGVFQSTCRKPDSARMTSLRRSVCKLVTLPPEVRDPLLEGEMPATVPLHALYLGWFTEGIDGAIEYSYGEGGAEENELEVFLEACREVDADCSINDVRHLISRAESEIPNFFGYANLIQNISQRAKCFEWIMGSFSILSTAEGMRRLLERIYADPVLRTEEGEEIRYKDHWLLDSIITLLRAALGGGDSFGYSEMATDTGIPRIDLALTPYLQRAKDLSDDVYESLSISLSERFSSIGYDTLIGAKASVARTSCESVFRFKMMNYRLFNPIDWLVEMVLLDRGEISIRKSAHNSFLSEHTAGNATETANILEVQTKPVWIKCQSGYDGKIDKRKELCGRIGAMKLCYDAEELAKRRFFLVIDGFFDTEDIQLFETAGWDGVYYYDELEDLAEAVMSFVSPTIIQFPDEGESLPMAADEG